MGGRRSIGRPTSPWQRGRLDPWGRRPTLLFGQMYEDHAVEAAVFPKAGRIFAIASAGTTSIALAALGLEVTAVDINPAQIAYVRRRLAGGPMQPGTADRLFAFGRRLLPVVGWSRRRVRAFLQLQDPARQLEDWRTRLETSRFRVALRILLSRVSLSTVYDRRLLEVIPRRFDLVMRRRLERCFAHHPNRSNPYAWRLLLGEDPPDQPEVRVVAERIQLVEADAATYLEGCSPATFDGFTLSNILDGTDAGYRLRLQTAVRRAARPGAVVVLRSFAEPAVGEDEAWAVKDRSILWGRVQVLILPPLAAGG